MDARFIKAPQVLVLTGKSLVSGSSYDCFMFRADEFSRKHFLVHIPRFGDCRHAAYGNFSV